MQLDQIDEDLPCRNCSYNLRGLVRERCPECGTHFDIAELRRYYASLSAISFFTLNRMLGWLILAMSLTGLLSILIQSLAYSDRTGPRSREWIVHNLPAPVHYIAATVMIPAACFCACLIVRLKIFANRSQRLRKPNQWISRRIMVFSFLAFVALVLQLSCLYTCATIGD
jgi:hypothetical protein